MGYMAGVHEVPDLDSLVEEVTENCSILQKSALLAEEAGYIGETAWTPPWGTASSALGTCRRCIEFHMNVPSSALRCLILPCLGPALVSILLRIEVLAADVIRPTR